MKIVSIETYAVTAKHVDTKAYWGSRAWGAELSVNPELSTEYPMPKRRSFIYSKTIDTVIVKITTDDGVVGYGESKAPVAPQATAQIVERLLKPVVMGADPRDVLQLWEKMYAGMRVRGHRAGFYLEAISGVDIALWDIIGKVSASPISQLLGGAARERVRVYASGVATVSRDAPQEAVDELVAEVKSLREQGYTGVKIALGRGLEGDMRCVRAISLAMGSDFQLYADAAGSYDRAQALKLGRMLEELDVVFFEMPIPPEDVEGYGMLARALDIPIALDSIASRYETVELIRNQGIDIVQPDVCRAGGITECRRIAELADAFGLGFQPHISIGSAIHVAASAHLAIAMPNTIVSEYWIGNNPIGNAAIEEPILVKDSYMTAPAGKGLGISIKEDVLLREAEKIVI